MYYGLKVAWDLNYGIRVLKSEAEIETETEIDGNITRTKHANINGN